MTAHLTLDAARLIPPDLRACLVLDMEETCPCCGHRSYREPVPVPPGLAPWKAVVVASSVDSRDLAITLDRDLHFDVPVAGVVGWGLVDLQGRLIWWQGLLSKPAKGDTVWVRREG